ncbi:zinc finger protein [Saccharopolyspora gloriosae]|uniref:zinc finger protein n=1 Tax=Saccharopolyspora gloriosae TaxID=455344 RepID=UPI001FB7ACF7|nr:zinc finger protein [Saccharopolyspora gloriosae]
MSPRHFWRPADGIRHAFHGPRWNGLPEATSVCGVLTTMPERISDNEWVRAPSCNKCNAILHAVRNIPHF